MGLGDVLDDGKTQPCATHLPASGLVNPVKTLEESRQMLLFYAAALVANAYADFTIRLRCLDQNGAPLMAELYRVIYEIYYGLLQKGGIDVGLQFLVARELKADLLRNCFDLTDLDGR